MNKSGKYLLFGIAAGAVAGLLLAPDKGAKTRQAIKDRLNQSAQEIGPELENVSKQVNSLVDKVNNIVQEFKKAKTSQMASENPVENM